MKKKIALLFVGLLMAVSANAQFEQGKMYANAGFSGIDLSFNSTQKWNLNLNLKLGYMVIDDLMVLADGMWGIRQKADNEFRLGGGVRYYIEQNGIYLGAGVRYKHLPDFDDFLPNVNVGYAFFLSRTVTVEPELYYDISTKSFKDYSGFGLRIGFGIYLDKLF
jgi:hypothetical protein